MEGVLVQEFDVVCSPARTGWFVFWEQGAVELWVGSNVMRLSFLYIAVSHTAHAH